MRSLFLPAILAGSLLVSVSQLSGEEAVYRPPEGQAAPVAPPLRKGSPLDHLANDPKQDTPTVGYREGNTKGEFVWIGHRLPDALGGQGWGWVKKAGESWGSAKWVALQETPGLAVAPHRKLFKSDADSNWEYKLWGKFASYKAYDPRMDEQIPVFVLQGYEVIGPATSAQRQDRPARSHPAQAERRLFASRASDSDRSRRRLTRCPFEPLVDREAEPMFRERDGINHSHARIVIERPQRTEEIRRGFAEIAR